MSSDVITPLQFSGTKSEQTLAKVIFDAMMARGRFVASDIPIRVQAAILVEFLKEVDKSATPAAILKAVNANPEIFGTEEVDGDTVISTTRVGRAPVVLNHDSTHSFAARFMTPEPKPEHPVVPLRPRSRGDARWSSLDRALAEFEMTDFEPLDDQAILEVVEAAEAIGEGAAAVQTDIEAIETMAEAIEPESLSVASIGDVALEKMIVDALSTDARVAAFAGEWMIEDRAPRLSRGDIRKIKDYIEEQDQPLTDDLLVQDVLEVRPKASDFDLMRFGLNFRLSKEHRDFDFVGTNDQRFWTMGTVTPIGTDRRKATDIGTDYKYLIDELPEQPAYRSVNQVSHILTFYEFTLGLLPYDLEIQALFPAPVTDGQRSAVLTFECPQSYTTYLVELRYPTGNRGGFILGLDDFYNENLVPGAVLTLTATGNDGHYVVEFEEAGTQSMRLLDLGDRRQKYAFRPTSFNCTVFEEYVIDEDRFPGFSGDKPMDDKARRKLDDVIAQAFVRRDSKIEGNGYRASFVELFAAANAERPFSETLLRTTLDEDQTGAFSKDPDSPDGYTYVPVNG